MFDPSKDSRHWLWALAELCGLVTPVPEETEAPISVSTPIAQAWKTTAEACELSEADLASFVAYRFGLPIANLDQVDPEAIALLPPHLARSRTVLPIRASAQKLVVATADPMSFDAEQDVRFVSGRFTAFEIAPPSKVLEGIDTHYGPRAEAVAILETVDDGRADAVRVVEEEDVAAHVEEEDYESGPVVKLSNLILNDAIQQRATDIHIQPSGHSGVVRFRVDGVLRQYLEVPRPVLVRIISRIKILGGMDISDRLRPQDGRARIETGGRAYDLRLSTVPARKSEKIVVRILDSEGSTTLAGLGIRSQDRERIETLLSYRNGIVAVTGPTGSGKTTTLYGALHRLATPEVNVMTVEDPIEYELPGVTQIQVSTKRGLTFASALRSILRQDPDVILVGEIRDRDTAEVAVQASLTGHLVLSTLHTNDAIGAIRRLVDLGLDATAICETLRGAVAQRLARRLCPECAVPFAGELSDRQEELARRFGVRPVMAAQGCDICAGQGFLGRLPLFQVFFMSPELEEAVREGRSPSSLRSIARDQGMRSLLDSGRDRIADGSTTLEEIERVVGDLPLCELGSVGKTPDRGSFQKPEAA